MCASGCFRKVFSRKVVQSSTDSKKSNLSNYYSAGDCRYLDADQREVMKFVCRCQAAVNI